MKKIIITFIMKEKKNWCRTDWATAQLYCEKKNCIARNGRDGRGIVLQDG